MTTVHISLMPKADRRAARKAGITFHQCIYCGLTVKRGDPRPMYSPDGYVHQWQEFYLADRHPWDTKESTK